MRQEPRREPRQGNGRVLKVQTLEKSIVIPTAAVQRGPAGTFVYVIGDDDVVAAKTVTVTQQNETDAVIATGVSHSVQELVAVAFGHVGLDWRRHVRLDDKFIRPAEVEHLIGDSSKALLQLGWKPAVDFAALIAMMVDADVARVARAPQLSDRLSTL